MERTIAAEQRASWVKETRIGTWFLGTDMWRCHVLPRTMDDLCTLLNGVPLGGRLLDIGCGQGLRFPIWIGHFRPDFLLGIDIDPELVERGAGLAAQCECRAEIRTGDATAIDLPDGSVDTIFCHQTFHHLADQEAAAREFYRVLAPGGRLLFTKSCRSFIYSWWVRLFFRHPMEAQKTAAEYQALLRRAGFGFGPKDVLAPYPPWARPDFGLSEAFGRPVEPPYDEPLVCLVARRPS